MGSKPPAQGARGAGPLLVLLLAPVALLLLLLGLLLAAIVAGIRAAIR